MIIEAIDSCGGVDMQRKSEKGGGDEELYTHLTGRCCDAR